MKERPILFSGAMVRALLAGTKMQTRRVVKPQPTHFNPVGVPRLAKPDGPNAIISCPYGQPGDRLWVRECVFINHYMGLQVPEADRADCELLYRATDEDAIKNMEDTEGLRWTPSIHMPRWASRITLEITGVRVERLQDISEADALAEGIVLLKDGFGLPAGEHFHCADPLQSYFSLWEAINGPGSVEANPWLWCVSFQRLADA